MNLGQYGFTQLCKKICLFIRRRLFPALLREIFHGSIRLVWFLGGTSLLVCNAHLAYPMWCGNRNSELSECAPIWKCPLARICAGRRRKCRGWHRSSRTVWAPTRIALALGCPSLGTFTYEGMDFGNNKMPRRPVFLRDAACRRFVYEFLPGEARARTALVGLGRDVGPTARHGRVCSRSLTRVAEHALPHGELIVPVVGETRQSNLVAVFACDGAVDHADSGKHGSPDFQFGHTRSTAKPFLNDEETAPRTGFFSWHLALTPAAMPGPCLGQVRLWWEAPGQPGTCGVRRVCAGP